MGDGIKSSWKEIKEFPGYYINRKGEVLSTKWNPKGLLRKTQHCPRGYNTVNFLKNKKQHTRRIHRLLALAFIPKPPGKTEVNHKNGKPSDNRIKNLEWVTSSENKLHSYRVLNRQPPSIGNWSAELKNCPNCFKDYISYKPSRHRKFCSCKCSSKFWDALRKKNKKGNYV